MAIPGTRLLVSALETRARQRGLRGNSGAWLAVWVLVVGTRYLRRLAVRQPVVVREVLAPGERLVITHRERSRRRKRRS